jgi:uncharacterized membrane protein
MWNEWLTNHKGKTIGVIIGIFFGFIYLIWGLWDMLIFAFIVYIGYYIGKRLDHKEPAVRVEHLWHWLTDRWRMFR